MHNFRNQFTCILIVLAVLMTPELARAQGTDLGTIRGTVTDASSAAVPNANVTIIDVATNARKLIITNELGEYEVPALRSGNYKVSIVATGFNTLEISNIVL